MSHNALHVVMAQAVNQSLMNFMRGEDHAHRRSTVRFKRQQTNRHRILSLLVFQTISGMATVALVLQSIDTFVLSVNATE